MEHKVIGLINTFNTPSLSPLTDSRPLASTSFLGRYALIDFPLSCLCNSNISQVGILVRDHQRSLLKHVGSMTTWVNNTKIAKNHIMFNENALVNGYLNTDINNLKENDWVFYSSDANYVVILPIHILAPIDLRPFIREHVEKGAELSIIGTKIKDASKEYIGQHLLEIDKDKIIKTASINNGKKKGEAIASMSIYIINRKLLGDLVLKHSVHNPSLNLEELIFAMGEANQLKRNFLLYENYSLCLSSFKDYMRISSSLLSYPEVSKLFNFNWPIYTVTHDTPPALYSKDAEVRSSYISNGAIIEGKVINSIIGRGVKVSKGAIVKNCIVFSNVTVGENAQVSYALIDKYAIITRSHAVEGKADDPIYIKQGAFV